MAGVFDTIFTIIIGTVVMGAIISIIFVFLLMMWLEHKYVTTEYDAEKRYLFGLIKPRLVSYEEKDVLIKAFGEATSPLMCISFVIGLAFMMIIVFFQ